jgi:tRNA(Ile2)-agmatinylcytidine synthase
MYIGIDDTDSRKGMCTTYLSLELIKAFEELDVIGYPRLVRLNPNIPWKTRGNGAICLRFGKGYGKRFLIAKIGEKKYYAYEKGKNVEFGEEAKERVQKIVEAYAQFEDKNTNPAFVITNNKFNQKLYWRAVRQVVDLDEIKSLIECNHSLYGTYKNGRGLIGATAAISWRPRDRTYEIIAYREKNRWGTEREINDKSVISMDRSFPSTFNNYDYINKSVVITPNSPCPVLFGIRGDKVIALPKAMGMIRSEKKLGWTMFLTNQGSDEHLQEKRISKVEPYQSVIIQGKVISKPRTIIGGHVVFSISDGKSIDCTAYEPSKQFRNVIRQLTNGDMVTVYGSVRKEPLTINIEKIRIDELVEIYQKVSNPVCKVCGKRMKSSGREGYKCKRCGTKAEKKDAIFKSIKRKITKRFYEPPVIARRHLSKPLKRFKDQTMVKK